MSSRASSLALIFVAPLFLSMQDYGSGAPQVWPIPPAAGGTSTEELRPNGDQSVDAGWDVDETSTDCGTSCFDEINEDFTDETDVDSNYLEYDTCVENTNRRDRFNMTNPTVGSTNLNTGTDAQTIRVVARKCNCLGNGDPNMTIEVYCSGDADGSPQVSSGSFALGDNGCSSGDGNVELNTFQWTYSFTCTGDGDDIEIGVFCSAQGGAPGGRRACDVAAIEWEATIDD